MSQSEEAEKQVVWAVLSYWDRPELSLDVRINLKEILPTKEEADEEVERLNELRDNDSGYVYFVRASRFYPNGRGAVKGY